LLCRRREKAIRESKAVAGAERLRCELAGRRVLWNYAGLPTWPADGKKDIFPRPGERGLLIYRRWERVAGVRR